MQFEGHQVHSMTCGEFSLQDDGIPDDGVGFPDRADTTNALFAFSESPARPWGQEGTFPKTNRDRPESFVIS